MSDDLDQRLLDAVIRYEREPHDLATVSEICDLLIALGREDELVPWVDRALEIGSRHPDFFSMRAHALDLLGHHAEAVRTRLQDPSAPSGDPRAPLRLGYSLMMAGELGRAMTSLEAARIAAADDPVIRATAVQLLGETMLKAGDPKGFAYWISRNDSHDAGNYKPAGIAEWNGESNLRDKRVMVLHQLGFGDNFLLAACVADWQAAGARVMITCDPQIHALMQASLPGCEVVCAERPLQMHAPLPVAIQAEAATFAPHLYATLLHLPLLRAARASTGYQFRPYMRAPQDKQRAAARWARELRARRPGKKLVGLFWDCHQRHDPQLGASMRCWATRRSMPLSAINRFVTHPDLEQHIQFVNLHHPLVEAAAGTPAGNVERYEPGVLFFDDTAACVGELDAVLAVDSAVANLAVMMGKPVCVPVNTSGDWRWGSRGTTSPWIERATVLRQTQEGNWDTVVRDAAAWLAALSPSRSTSAVAHFSGEH